MQSGGIVEVKQNENMNALSELDEALFALYAPVLEQSPSAQPTLPSASSAMTTSQVRDHLLGPPSRRIIETDQSGRQGKDPRGGRRGKGKGKGTDKDYDTTKTMEPKVGEIVKEKARFGAFSAVGSAFEENEKGAHGGQDQMWRPFELLRRVDLTNISNAVVTAVLGALSSLPNVWTGISSTTAAFSPALLQENYYLIKILLSSYVDAGVVPGYLAKQLFQLCQLTIAISAAAKQPAPWLLAADIVMRKQLASADFPTTDAPILARVISEVLLWLRPMLMVAVYWSDSTFSIVNGFTPEEEAQIKKENQWAEEVCLAGLSGIAGARGPSL
ncbi:hypothetical protein JCM11641_000554 [Rhodosporidiobolus odoratus]